MKIGKQTIKFENTPVLRECGSVVGPKEKSGPLSEFFDTCLSDVYFGEETFEKAESKLIKEAVQNVFNKTNLDNTKIDYMFAGDLLNQCISSGYAARDIEVPYIGLYGACSTFAEANIMASVFVNSGCATHCIAAASSHFCSAERQFRMPLEQGTQTPPTGQWTVTGAGATLIVPNSEDTQNRYPRITYATPGKIVDMGVTDIANMGAAMAPACFDTIVTHLEDTGRDANYYDLICTGDLGILGSDILKEQLKHYGIDIYSVHNDCGMMIFDCNAQDTKTGGSGCGCSASVFSGYVFKKLMDKSINRVLLISTGALMSPVSLGQGESIPGVAHAIAIENI